MSEFKICYSCKEQKTLDLFKKNKRRKDGVSQLCKKCNVKETLDLRKRNKGLIKNKPEYLIKYCKTHGDLSYENIGLIIYNAVDPIVVDMTCLFCKSENQKRKYNNTNNINNIFSELIECYICSSKKHVSYFYQSELKRKSPACSECIKIKQKPYKEKSSLKLRFNLTIEQFDLLLKGQNNVCKICKNPETRTHRLTKEITKLSIDHCHKTGKIRGLLCRDCNLMIGNSKDNPGYLRAGADYLEL